MTTNENDEVIAAGAFGDSPKEVPLRAGQNGPQIGTATVSPDGSFTAVVNQFPGAGEGVKVEMAGRTLLDQNPPYRVHLASERLIWEEKALHTPGIVHALTGPDAGLPAEMERWEAWHLAYVQKLATELQYTATTAASIMARRDGAL